MITIIIITLFVTLALCAVNLLLLLSARASARPDKLRERVAKLDDMLRSLDARLREEFERSRGESQKSSRENREELANSFRILTGGLNAAQDRHFEAQSRQVAALRDSVETRLRSIQQIVDEKLRDAVGRSFDESFKTIKDRLEQVHKGLGEMQALASGVGDLKKVLSGVKTRGNLGEIQLGAILEQFLSREQYEVNAAVKAGSSVRVEYAIKLPGGDRPVLLPVDAKFPTEDYERLQSAREDAPNARDAEASALRQFESAVRKCARDIRDKYVDPPATTDFAIMFVPSEGLYAEILRSPSLFETLQREFKVTVVGPANLVAFLNSLRMGFRTLAVEKRSSEVWELLGAVKKEFTQFGDLLDKTGKKLQEAANTINDAGVRSRAIERKLKAVETPPQDNAETITENHNGGELCDQESGTTA